MDANEGNIMSLREVEAPSLTLSPNVHHVAGTPSEELTYKFVQDSNQLRNPSRTRANLHVTPTETSPPLKMSSLHQMTDLI